MVGFGRLGLVTLVLHILPPIMSSGTLFNSLK